MRLGSAALPTNGAKSSDPGQECRGAPTEANPDGEQTMVGIMGFDGAWVSSDGGLLPCLGHVDKRSLVCRGPQCPNLFLVHSKLISGSFGIMYLCPFLLSIVKVAVCWFVALSIKWGKCLFHRTIFHYHLSYALETVTSTLRRVSSNLLKRRHVRYGMIRQTILSFLKIW